MVLVTACILTKNSSSTIEETLKNISPVVDEIVVIDGYSSDKTVQICKKYGARVYRHKWSGSYSRERNLCLSKARGEWILVVDSDERLSKPLQKFIQDREFMKYADQGYDSFAFSRLNYVPLSGKWKALKHGIFYPDWQIRLFRKGAFYQGDIHEQPNVANVKYIEYPIIHTPEQSIADFAVLKSKYKNYAKIESTMFLKRGSKTNAIAKFFLASYGPIYSLVLFSYSYIYKKGFLDGFEGLKANLIYTEAKLLAYLYAAV
ncbi:glycosyltransferase family 2 protein [Thermococcus sp. 2319x1]|uniref:glycosyltransferase family 2 protein n=1 Tax=Thermococcus sp. 2319x1 TaxID=1674923 RepID=UPI001581D625|nr:glycosyltransferase family 2 protein [Thermococcus sp. 2319x1]